MASKSEPAGRRGRVAGATREEVLACARAHFLACERIDVRAIAAEVGVGRATMYRWFGTREQLVGEAMLGVVENRIGDARAAVGGHGGEALQETFDLIYRGLSGAPHVRAVIDAERAMALSVITSSSGIVHPRMLEIVKGLIDDETERGYRPPADSTTLSYVLVRFAEGLLFNYSEDDLPKDLDRLADIMSALLGVRVEES